MTPEETARAIELLLQSQQIMQKNLETLVGVVNQLAGATAHNARDIAALNQHLDRLATIVSDYLHGFRNGHQQNG
jgi:dethiobiotin synthetase